MGRRNRQAARALPREVQQIVTAAGATIHGSCKTLEEVVLLRKVAPGRKARVAGMVDVRAQRLLHGEDWDLPHTPRRDKVERGTSVPFSERAQAPFLQLEDGDGGQRQSSTAIVPYNEGEATEARNGAIQALKEELGDVLRRLEALESEHRAAASNQLEDAQDKDAASSASRFISGGREKEEMVLVMDGIQETIAQLERTLTASEQQARMREEQYTSAATRITALARGFLNRRRYSHAKRALARWRSRNGAAAVREHAIALLRRKARLMARAGDFHMIVFERFKERNFQAWRAHTISMRGERQRVIESAKEFRASIERNFIKSCFTPWAVLATGPESRKAIRERNEKRYTAARERLVRESQSAPEAQRRTIVREEVVEAMNAESVRLIAERRAFHAKRIYFSAWSEEFLFGLLQLKKRADRFFTLNIFPRFFAAWRKFVSVVQSEAKVAFSYCPERFDAGHNERVIANFAYRIRTRKTFQGWRNLMERNRETRLRFRRVMHRRLGAVFFSWRARARFQTRVKRVCIEEWRELSVRRRQTPFRAWYIHVREARKQREAQQVLLDAFARRKARLLTTRMFRQWQHKAIYGRTGGLHNRAALIKALETQKEMVMAMEVSSVQQKDTIAELEEALAKEKDRSADLQVELAGRDEQIIKHRFAQQHLEAEVVRLQSLFDSISLIHPGTSKRLMQIEEDKQPFKDKGVGQVARRMGQKSKMVNGEGDAGGAGGGDGSLIPAVKNGGPCRKCGARPDEPVVRALSARGVARLPPQSRDPGPDSPRYGLTRDNVVWVTSRDADVIMRTAWVERKIRALAKKQAEAADDGTLPAQSTESAIVEARNLRSLIAFLFTGDRDAVEIFDYSPEDAARALEAEALVAAPDAPRSPQLTVAKASLHTHASWNDFVQGIDKQFPLLHPVNNDPKKALARRINEAKHHVRQNRLRGPRARVNVYNDKSPTPP